MTGDDDRAGAPPPGATAPAEAFERLLARPGVRIERIVSRGHVTPPDEPYDQAWDEWVMVLAGEARLDLHGRGEVRLAAGDHVLIPARIAHRVTYTADPTIWLAVHFDTDG